MSDDDYPVRVGHWREQARRWKEEAGKRSAVVSHLRMENEDLRQNGAMHGHPIKLTVADLSTVVRSMVAAAPVGYRHNEWIDSITSELNKLRHRTQDYPGAIP